MQRFSGRELMSTAAAIGGVNQCQDELKVESQGRCGFCACSMAVEYS
jgi:hypothetical protein